MSAYKYLVFLLIGIVVLVFISTFLVQRLQSPSSAPLPQSRVFPTGVGGEDVRFTIKDEGKGRSELYANADLPNTFTKKGIVMREDAPKRAAYVLGIFQGWEDIPGSEDKTIIIYDLDSKQPLVRARVFFDKESVMSETERATGLAFENIAKIRAGESGFQGLKPAGYYGYDTVVGLVAIGDIVVVKPWYEGKSDTDYVKDENQNMLAQWLVIRRSEDIEIKEK